MSIASWLSLMAFPDYLYFMQFAGSVIEMVILIYNVCLSLSRYLKSLLFTTWHRMLLPMLCCKDEWMWPLLYVFGPCCIDSHVETSIVPMLAARNGCFEWISITRTLNGLEFIMASVSITKAKQMSFSFLPLDLLFKSCSNSFETSVVFILCFGQKMCWKAGMVEVQRNWIVW